MRERLRRRTASSVPSGCATTERGAPAGFLQHVKLTVIAVVVGFCDRVLAALAAQRLRWFERPFDLVSALLYTIPSLALFQLLVPITGLHGHDRRGRARLAHAPDPLPEHPDRFHSVPADVLEAARGMGWARPRS